MDKQPSHRQLSCIPSISSAASHTVWALFSCLKFSNWLHCASWRPQSLFWQMRLQYDTCSHRPQTETQSVCMQNEQGLKRMRTCVFCSIIFLWFTCLLAFANDIGVPDKRMGVIGVLCVIIRILGRSIN